MGWSWGCYTKKALNQLDLNSYRYKNTNEERGIQRSSPSLSRHLVIYSPLETHLDKNGRETCVT